MFDSLLDREDLFSNIFIKISTWKAQNRVFGHIYAICSERFNAPQILFSVIIAIQIFFTVIIGKQIFFSLIFQPTKLWNTQYVHFQAIFRKPLIFIQNFQNFETLSLRQFWSHRKVTDLFETVWLRSFKNNCILGFYLQQKNV